MLTITLPPELEQPIIERARRIGITPELMALNSLRNEFMRDMPAPSAEGTLADFLGDFIGCLDSGDLDGFAARSPE